MRASNFTCCVTDHSDSSHVSDCSTEISTLLADLQYNRHTSEDSPSVVRRSPETYSATVIGVVLLAFVLCYCVENYFSFCQNCPLILVDVVLLFLLINAAANPLAYALLEKDIRRQVKTLFKCNVKCNQIGNNK